MSMMYTVFDAQRTMAQPLRSASATALRVMAALPQPWANSFTARHIVAWNELILRGTITQERPPFGIDSVRLDGRDLSVTEDCVHQTPFARLLRFRKADSPEATTPDQPRVLVVAPMSGHFATLLSDTIRTLLPEHDVYVTDWRNARDIPLEAGRFGMDEYVEHVMEFVRVIGPGAHVLAVCQPCVQVLAAVSLMEQFDDPATPLSMTLMAGPIDTTASPNAVDQLATSLSVEQFHDTVITTVPQSYAGRGRKVYPGFVQLSAFLSMNPGRHIKAHREYYDSVVAGDQNRAKAIGDFYDEYCAVQDLPAEFYLETLKQVFQDNLLARDEMTWRGHPVDPSRIVKTALLTVEGSRDDICGLGQTEAAHRLCSQLPEDQKKHHVQPDAGHYGVFSGRRWQHEVYPLVRDFVARAEQRSSAKK